MRQVLFEKDRSRLEIQIGRLAQSLDSLACMYDQCEERIASLNESDASVDITQYRREVRAMNQSLNDLETQNRQSMARVMVLEKERERLRNSQNSVQLKVQSGQLQLVNLRMSQEQFIQKMQTKMQQTIRKTSAITEGANKVHSKRAFEKASIQRLIQKIAETEEAERTVKAAMQKTVSDLAGLEMEVKSVKVRALEKKRDFGEIHEKTLAEEERHRNFEKRIVNLQADIETAKRQASEALFERDKIRVTFEQQKAVLVDDELRMRDFYDTMDEIDSAERDSFRLEQREKDLQNESVDLEIRALDLTREKAVHLDIAHGLKMEFDEEQEILAVLNEKVSDIKKIVQAQEQATAKLEHRKMEMLTISNTLYAPTPYSPQGWQSSKVIHSEIEERVKARKRKLAILSDRATKLEDKVTELSARNSFRKAQAKRREFVLHQRLQTSRDFKMQSGVPEEKVLGFNSIQDFSRLLNDELRSRNGFVVQRHSAALSAWEMKINELFEMLDIYYLK
jgi:chromosome segregation ATPase